MGTRFEIAMVEDRDPMRLRAAAEEALAEIDQIEARLSLHRETSEIARVNALASQRPVRLSVEVFNLLSLCLSLSRTMEGAFDPTVGPLMRCWGFVRGTGCEPTAEALAAARDCVGAQWVEMDETKREVFFRKPGMMLDLGAIGKGYALDVAVERLREAGVVHALIHGGTSSVFGLGAQEDGRPWSVAVENPDAEVATPSRLLSVFPLEGRALSVSAVWGKSFQSGSRRMGHVMDPRSGLPVSHTQLAAVSLASATECEALSTALLTLGSAWIPSLRQQWPSAKAVVLSATGGVDCL